MAGAVANWIEQRLTLNCFLQSEKQEKLLKIETDVESERLRELKRKEMIEKEKLVRFAQLEKWKVNEQWIYFCYYSFQCSIFQFFALALFCAMGSEIF